jgi:hypothetical protein
MRGLFHRCDMTINRAFALPVVLLFALSACDGAVPRANDRLPSPPPRNSAPVVLPPMAAPAPHPPLSNPAPANVADWRDVPLPPGDWTWSKHAGGSVARYGAVDQPSVAILRCDHSAKTVQVALPAEHPADQDAAPRRAVITTSTSSGTATAAPVIIDGQMMWSVTLPASDHVLDAMAFSRGRFRIAITGLAPQVLPSWAEVGRVVEDCRG